MSIKMPKRMAIVRKRNGGKMNFWERCVKAGCVIVPIKTYSRYTDRGGTDESMCEGIRFIALQSEADAVGPDYYFEIEQSVLGCDNYYMTPEEALAAYEKSREEYERERAK